MDLIRPTCVGLFNLRTADTASQHVFRQHLQEAQGVYTEHVPMRACQRCAKRVAAGASGDDRRSGSKQGFAARSAVSAGR